MIPKLTGSAGCGEKKLSSVEAMYKDDIASQKDLQEADQKYYFSLIFQNTQEQL
jgi:hypothetical protein